ncbi:hypothetical protein F2Q70_00013708 [Brassica cretica]|uniref:Uncharacterized protein n=1 Tax=Brassica cretica TaxID=69181 RepID=A0A8S9M5X7_BRACR|nr:hypothetical protein F2Q70_00013708 [Brassica cretica]
MKQENQGNGEGSRLKTTRREDGRDGATGVGAGAQVAFIRPSPEQSRVDQSQRVTTQETREEGEIKSNGDDDVTLPSVEFQIELAKTHAEGTEVIMEATEEERGLRFKE